MWKKYFFVIEQFGIRVFIRWQSSCDELEINLMDGMARYDSERSLHSLQPMHPGHSTYAAASTSPTTPTSPMTPTMCGITLTKVTISSTHVPTDRSPDSPSKSMSMEKWKSVITLLINRWLSKYASSKRLISSNVSISHLDILNFENF